MNVFHGANFGDDRKGFVMVRDQLFASVCGECLCANANGTESMDLSVEREAQIWAGFRKNSINVPSNDRIVWVSTGQDFGFSTWSCDMCEQRSAAGDGFELVGLLVEEVL